MSDYLLYIYFIMSLDTFGNDVPLKKKNTWKEVSREPKLTWKPKSTLNARPTVAPKSGAEKLSVKWESNADKTTRQAIAEKNRVAAERTEKESSYKTKIKINRDEVVENKIADKKRDGKTINGLWVWWTAAVVLWIVPWLVLQWWKEVVELVKGKKIEKNEKSYTEEYNNDQLIKEQSDVYANMNVWNYQNVLLDLLWKWFDSRKNHSTWWALLRSVAWAKFVDKLADKFEQNLALDKADIWQVNWTLAEINKWITEAWTFKDSKEIYPNWTPITVSEADIAKLKEIKTYLEKRDLRLEVKKMTRMEVMLDAWDQDEAIKDYIWIDGAFRDDTKKIKIWDKVETINQTEIWQKIEKSGIWRTLVWIFDSIDDNNALKHASKSELEKIKTRLDELNVSLAKSTDKNKITLNKVEYTLDEKQLKKFEKMNKKVNKRLRKMK